MHLNKNVTLFLIGLLSFINSFSQIQLNPEKIDIETVNFYISEVIDGRKNKDNIGYKRNWLDEKTHITLESNATTAIQDFLAISLPNNLGLTPIILKVLYLNVKNERIDGSTNTARVEIKLEFYKEDNLGLKKVFEIEHYEDYNFDDFSEEGILNIYEKKIKSVLKYCLNEFSQKNWKNKTTNTYSRQEATKPSNIEKLTITKGDDLLKWVNILSYRIIRNKHTEGWSVSYIGFTENKKIILPFIYSFSRYRIKPESLENSNYKSANYFTPSFGTTFYYKLFPRFYANIALQVPVGVEILRDNNDIKSTNFIVGIMSSQGLMYIPKSNFGLMLGAGIYQKAQTSKIYKTDFGIELSVGIKF